MDARSAILKAFLQSKSTDNGSPLAEAYETERQGLLSFLSLYFDTDFKKVYENVSLDEVEEVIW